MKKDLFTIISDQSQLSVSISLGRVSNMIITYPVHIPLSDNASLLFHDPIGYGQSYYRGKRTSSPQRKQQHSSSGHVCRGRNSNEVKRSAE